MTSSLAAYAAKQPSQHNKCRICALPVAVTKQVADGLAQGIQATTIARWLTDETGERFSPESVRSHSQRHL